MGKVQRVDRPAPPGARSNRDRDVHVLNVSGASKYWIVVHRGNLLDQDGYANPDLFRRQSDARIAGKLAAQRLKCELVVHGKDGRIKSKQSYGNDPKGRKG